MKTQCTCSPNRIRRINDILWELSEPDCPIYGMKWPAYPQMTVAAIDTGGTLNARHPYQPR